MGDEVDFLSVDTNKIFLQDDSIISLEYLKENTKDEDDFLPADKC